MNRAMRFLLGLALTGLTAPLAADDYSLVPDEFRLHAHHWLILPGRYTCIARKPRCQSCTIVDLCEFRNKNID